MFKFIFVFLTLATVALPAHAVGSLIAVEIFGAVSTWGFAAYATAFAINMVASAIINKAFYSPQNYDMSGSSANVGNRQQLSPATDNKLPVVYGTAFVGGIVTDLTISSDNQDIYYVIALSEVTNNGYDTITFGEVYWGGKKVVFNSTNQYKVDGLLDESTGLTDTSVAGYIDIYLYSNGSNSPANSSSTAISVLQASNLVYKWDSTKLMSNCAFAVVHLKYNSGASVTGLQQTKFELTNSRTQTGDVIYDYMTNQNYGAGLPSYQINTASLTTLTNYSNESFSYVTASGSAGTQARFLFDGVIDTARSVMDNLQDMASCCDALIKYNEITAQWGIITQTPSYTVAMDLNDSNITSSIQITPLDIAASYNVAEIKFPDTTTQDSFNTATFDLATIAPSLLYPNEPINKVSISLPLVNNSVRAQYLAYRLLKAGREDLQIQLNVNFIGLQLEAGDIVTVTNANYGWVSKLFRIAKCVQNVDSTGAITVSLTLMEYNSTVYDDVSITEFQTAPNTGIGDPTTFGTVPAPVVSSTQPTAANPSVNITITTSSAGITQYAELWYSAFSNPTSSQRIFAGTTAIQSNGNPYSINTVMPDVTLTNIPAGNWYFFSRMVNSLGNSVFSPASAVFQWKPNTIQFVDRYLAVVYADDINGSGLSLTQTDKLYYGLSNQSGITVSTNPSDYTWYLATPTFDIINYLLFINRTGRKFSFGVGTADYAAGTASFVPTDTSTYDPSIWSGLPNGINVIDLDARTGQLTKTGTSTVGTGEIALTNSPNGTLVASLAKLLDFGTGVYTKTFSAATVTVDTYGRIVGVETPDDFFYSMTAITSGASETVFPVTRGYGYIVGQCWVFINGLFIDPSEYTDSATQVTLHTAVAINQIVTIISFKSENSSSVPYASFSINSVTLSNQSTYTASGFTLTSGYELLFLNGCVVNAADYNISGQMINFLSNASGDLQIIQWTQNNNSQPNGTPVNADTYTIIGQTVYPFSYDPNAFNLYNNGVLQLETVDYYVGSGEYTLAVPPTTISNILVQQTFARTGAV